MKKISVKDKYQSYEYVLQEPEGRSFSSDFTPDLTPKEMMELGVFGGTYFIDSTEEFPKEWFRFAKISENYDEQLNFFKVGASQDLLTWQRKGWIFPEDPKGWFQWYCRYYLGRRVPEMDRVQIKRWKAMKRHVAQIKKNCARGDLNCRRRQRQAVLHWAYDSRKI